MLLVKRKTTAIGAVCHGNNLKQLVFDFFGKHFHFILYSLVCFHKNILVIQFDYIFFFKNDSKTIKFIGAKVH